MDFRVYIIIEAPILEQKYELLVPIDRRIHDLISILKKTIPELNEKYYSKNEPNLYNKSNGKIYPVNTIIKNSDIKTGTRLVLV